MNAYKQPDRRPTHLEIQEAATEPQAIISWGEECLERAHRVAHGIEDHVRQLLNAPKNSSFPHGSEAARSFFGRVPE
ncbi:MAG: hypothetical protein ACYC3I_20010 [Gemmataceae bacterium]